MVEVTTLERWHRGNPIAGSNPALSARQQTPLTGRFCLAGRRGMRKPQREYFTGLRDVGGLVVSRFVLPRQTNSQTIGEKRWCEDAANRPPVPAKAVFPRC